MIDILRVINGKETLVCSVAADNASQASEIMGRDEVSINLTVDEPLPLTVGNFIRVSGTIYTLNREPGFDKKSDVEYQYNLIFEGPVYRLLDKLFVNPISRLSVFTVSRNLKEFVRLITDNMNEIDPGWLPASNLPDTEPRNLAFDTTSCRNVLTRLAEEFDTEYYLAGKTIHFTERIGNPTGFVFEQGKGKGLYSISQEPVDNENTVTRLYPYGGSQNIKTGEGDANGRLFLPEKYLENFSEYNKVVEKEVEFPEIFPRFQGIVKTASGSDNKTITCPEIDFNITEHTISGTPAMINFLTGTLMGESFEFGWNNTTKEITLISKEDTTPLAPGENTKPNLPNTAKHAAPGDRFNLTNLLMPLSFVTRALDELRAKATEWLAFYSHSRVKYTLEIDHRFLRDKNTLHEGDLVTISIPETQTSKQLRITSVERNLHTGKVTCTVSNFLEEKWQKSIEGRIEKVSQSSNAMDSNLRNHVNNLNTHLSDHQRSVLSRLFVDDEGNLFTTENFYSQQSISARTTTPSGTHPTPSGSLGSLVNIGPWADQLPSAPRIMVQLSGATHWSSKLLSEVTGLDTEALYKYLTTNNYALKEDIPSLTGYATETFVTTRIGNLVNGAPAALDTLKEIADVLQTNVNSVNDLLTALGSKWTQNSTQLSNWDNAYNWGNHATAGYATQASVNTNFYGLTNANLITVSWKAKELTFENNTLLKSSPDALGVYESTLAAKGFCAKQILSSNNYADWLHVPPSGIYAKGNILSKETIAGKFISATDGTTIKIGNANGIASTLYTHYISTAAAHYFNKQIEVDGDIKIYSAGGNILGGTNNGVYLQLGNIRIVYDATNNALKVIKSDGTAANLYSTGALAARHAGAGTEPGSGGLIKNVYAYADLDKTYSNTTLTDTFNAYTINEVNKRLKAVEAKGLDTNSLAAYLNTNGYLNSTGIASFTGNIKANTLTAANYIGQWNGADQVYFFTSRGSLNSSDLNTFVSRNTGSYLVQYAGATSKLLNFNDRAGSTSSIEMLFHYDVSNPDFFQVRSGVDGNRNSEFISVYTSGNANKTTIDWAANCFIFSNYTKLQATTWGIGAYTSTGEGTYFTARGLTASDTFIDTANVPVNGIYSKGLILSKAGFKIGDDLTDLSKGGNNALRITMPTGYCDIGSQNSGYFHFETDRERFHFNKPLYIDGEIFAGTGYNKKVLHAGNASCTAAWLSNVGREYTLNLAASMYDQDTFYPVTIYISTTVGTKFWLTEALSGRSKPTWSAHSGGFSVAVEWESNGHGWGTIPISRYIKRASYMHTNSGTTPFGGIAQMANASREVFWIRGGGIYTLHIDGNNEAPEIHTSPYTHSNQTITTRTLAEAQYAWDNLYDVTSGLFAVNILYTSGNTALGRMDLPTITTIRGSQSDNGLLQLKSANAESSIGYYQNDTAVWTVGKGVGGGTGLDFGWWSNLPSKTAMKLSPGGTLSIYPTTINYTEGIRIANSSNNWSLILFGAVGDENTSANAWMIGKNDANALIFDRNGSFGATGNGMTLNSAGQLSVSKGVHCYSGYFTTANGWFQNDVAGTGLYNAQADARWYAVSGKWYADKAIDAKGFINAARFITGYDSGVTGSMSCSGWFRSSGSTGWLNDSYTGGIYQDDAEQVKVYNNKVFYNDGFRVWGIGGHHVGLKLYNASHIGINLANNTYTWGIYANANGTLYIGRRNGDVNDTSGDYALTIGGYDGTMTYNGNFSATGSVTARSVSDIRLKENIVPIEDALSIIRQLHPFYHTWKQTAFGYDANLNKGCDVGLSAQESEKIYPFAVSNLMNTGFLALEYQKFIPLTIAAINELACWKDEKSLKIEALESRVKYLETQLNKA